VARRTAQRQRAKFPKTTGIYRRVDPDKRSQTRSFGDLLVAVERVAQATLARAESTAEAKANAQEALTVYKAFLDLWTAPPAEMAEITKNWAGTASMAAFFAGMMLERLIVRQREDAALHGLEITDARREGGRATGAERRQKAEAWRAEAQPLADCVWQRHPGWSRSAVAKKIAPQLGRAWHTVRATIRAPDKES
jgi:hypothetical protein